MLDHLLDGRFTFGISYGGLMSDAEAFGNIDADRRAKVSESGYLPKPPHPPIVVTAVAPFSAGIAEAAARGWDTISANFLLPQ